MNTTLILIPSLSHELSVRRQLERDVILLGVRQGALNAWR